MNSGGMSALGMWRLSIDATSLEAEATYLPERTASEQGDAFLLPLNRFITASTFELLEVGRESDQLLVRYRVTHPFAAPSDPAAASTATNRADLGFAGVVLFLADVDSAEGQTFFDDVVANTELVANADAYWQPGGMIARTSSMTANCFPGLNVVDESGTGNRVGISNGGNPTGNFGTNGWTRTDLGEAPFTGWTGYGILHQGQAADRTVSINLAAIAPATSISLDVALIAKYTDPRGGSTSAEKQANRLPSKPADFRSFAYRMPHGALDVSSCRVSEPSGPLTVEPINVVTINCQVLDWDADAEASSAVSLAEEADLNRVRPGAAGPPILLLDVPGVMDAPVAGVQQTTGSQQIAYQFTLGLHPELSSAVGRHAGLIKLTDPEASLATSALTTLDEALQPISAEFTQPSTYQRTQIEVAPATWAALFLAADTPGVINPASYVYHLLVDQAGNTYIQGIFIGEVNFLPGVGGATLADESGLDTFVLSLTTAGKFRWLVHWPDGEFCDSMALSTDGSLLYLSSTLGKEFDLDPGSGTDLRTSDSLYNPAIVALTTLDGRYAWGHAWNYDWAPPNAGFVYDLTVHPATGEALLALGFGVGAIDLDPGPGVMEIDSDYVRLGVMALDAQGQFRRFSHIRLDHEHGHSGGLTTLAAGSSGTILMSGFYGGTVDFDPGVGVQNRTADHGQNSGSDIFTLKLDSTGRYQWVAIFESSSGSGKIEEMVIAPSGGIAMDGTFSGMMDVDPTTGVDQLSAVSNKAQFFICLAGNAALKWAGTFDQYADVTEFVINSANQLLLPVSWQWDGDIDPGPSFWQPERFGSQDTILMTLDFDSGARLRTDHLHGSPGDYVALLALATDPVNDALLWGGGFLGDEIDFDIGPGTVFLPPPNNNQHGLVLRLGPDGSW